LKISLVISVYNEEDVLPIFWEELVEHMERMREHTFEVIWVNDGSSDSSQSLINKIEKEDQSERRSHISIEFSRNFGHEAAMTAGINDSTGDAVICLDADLQHPPSKIPEMIQSFSEGNDIVIMSRKSREDHGVFKRGLSRWFYRLLNNLSDFKFEENASDFFLISKRVAEFLEWNYNERNRFIRGFIQTIGFNRKTLEFDAPKRQGGESKYSFRTLLSLANIAIFSFSKKPLYLALLIALIFIFLTGIVAIFSLGVYFFGEKPPPGYTTLIIFLSVCFTIQYLLIGILSIYIGKSIEEIKERPIYIVKNYSGSVKMSSDKGSRSDNAELSESQE
jgi:dolichol-phosphate mannosyltransferase